MTQLEHSEVATDPGTRPALSLSGVTVEFESDRGTVCAFRDVDLTLRDGGFLSILGPSGCGKSTLLRVIADLVQPTAGTVSVLGSSPGAARTARAIGFVFQDASLLPWRTALQNVALPLEIRGAPRGGRTPAELLELVGLAGRENAFPHELSGGMRQRVAIARALALSPDLVVCDEPVSALDVSVQAQVLDLLRELQAEQGLAYLFISHDLAVVRSIAHRVGVLQHGQLVELRPTEQLYSAPEHPYTVELLAAVAGQGSTRREPVGTGKALP